MQFVSRWNHGENPWQGCQAEYYVSLSYHEENPWQGCQTGILTYQSLS